MLSESRGRLVSDRTQPLGRVQLQAIRTAPGFQLLDTIEPEQVASSPVSTWFHLKDLPHGILCLMI
jgi:hypothetical protein